MSIPTHEQNIKIAEKIRSFHSKSDVSISEIFRKFGPKYGITENRVRRILRNDCWAPFKLPEGNWKPITLLGKLFYVSDDGRVWSIDSQREIGSMNAGYRIIGVQGPDKKLISFRVHRLVLELFDRPGEPDEVGRHLDDNRCNNNISNLSWGSQYENSDDAIANGRTPVGSKSGLSKLDEKTVLRIVNTYDKSVHGGVKTYAAMIISEWDLPVSIATIVRIFRGANWAHVTKIKRRHINGEGIPFDMKAARSVHVNWNKSSLCLSEFCVAYAKFLVKQGYASATKEMVRNVVLGKKMKRSHYEFHLTP